MYKNRFRFIFFCSSLRRWTIIITIYLKFFNRFVKVIFPSNLFINLQPSSTKKLKINSTSTNVLSIRRRSRLPLINAGNGLYSSSSTISSSPGELQRKKRRVRRSYKRIEIINTFELGSSSSRSWICKSRSKKFS